EPSAIPEVGPAHPGRRPPPLPPQPRLGHSLPAISTFRRFRARHLKQMAPAWGHEGPLMILAILRLRFPPDQMEEIARSFWPVLGPTRVEPGCLCCALYTEVCYPEVLQYVEEWATSEDLERHMRSARYERLLAIMETAAEPPVLRYYLISATKGLEYLEAI